MDTAQWPQANSDHRHLVNEMGLVAKSSLMEEIMVPSGAGTTASSARPQLMERRPRPQREQALNCPRCQSTNTKFCYYNNYSLTQPRYFCKTCRRYWTEGGSLRNVPVGGGSRKNKRPSSSSTITTKTSSTPSTTPTSSLSSSATSARNLPPDHLAPPPGSTSFQNPKFHDGQDLNLAFPPQQQHMNGSLGEFPTMESSNAGANPPTCSSAAATGGTSISAMELLRSGLSAHGAPPSHFMPMMAAAEAGVAYPSVFGLQDFRSTSSLSFSLDGIGGGYGNVQGVQEGTAGVGRVFFPYEDLRQVSSTPTEMIEQNRVQGAGTAPSGFWNGVMGGGAGSW